MATFILSGEHICAESAHVARHGPTLLPGCDRTPQFYLEDAMSKNGKKIGSECMATQSLELAHVGPSLEGIKTVDFSLQEMVQNKLGYLGMFFEMLNDNPNMDGESYHLVGQALYEKVEDEINKLFEFVEKQCGPICIVQAMFGQEGIQGGSNVAAKIGEYLCGGGYEH